MTTRKPNNLDFLRLSHTEMDRALQQSRDSIRATIAEYEKLTPTQQALARHVMARGPDMSPQFLTLAQQAFDETAKNPTQ